MPIINNYKTENQNEGVKHFQTRAPPSGHGSVIAFDESLSSFRVNNL